MVLDESMVKWMGTGMPGLMVILRKPTPIGLELHTLCCAQCGVLVWFEIYEGKEAMALKKYNGEYPKSVALTLRMVEPFFSTGRVLIADSWFGSVACALALFRHGIFAVMNVKTATKNYPKEELLAEVAEIKGNSAEARTRRRERRGKQVAFVRRYRVGAEHVTLLAAGHNKKVPLLLIATCGSMLEGKTHIKTWQACLPDGSVKYYTLTTKQPQVHELYRQWMNIVDVMNKLRQGVVSMADVWHTTQWSDRHFAEGLGFWEVNVFKTLVYFYPRWKDLAHGEFRARLAWALLTLGTQPYPADEMRVRNEEAMNVETAAGYATLPCAPLSGTSHTYKRHSTPHRCAYCGKPCYWMCMSCRDVGLGMISVCGSKTKRGCMSEHVRGEPIKHATAFMSALGKNRVAESNKRRHECRGSIECDSADDEM